MFINGEFEINCHHALPHHKYKPTIIWLLYFVVASICTPCAECVDVILCFLKKEPTIVLCVS